ncbi:hypothetical protein [Pelagerythrobacter rhizovicinus]|uniref:hypothetical protein n=1 Tax=Pelagerythrobacter rhizovicinus TaxID=2268576 RepID=UPI001CDCC6EE|nr:hypothetical protein [Pelagerythrobacter rhizovicinus]
MPIEVVDGLEAVEVDQCHGHLLPRGGGGDVPVQRAAVGKLAETVGHAEPLEPRDMGKAEAKQQEHSNRVCPDADDEQRRGSCQWEIIAEQQREPDRGEDRRQDYERRDHQKARRQTVIFPL